MAPIRVLAKTALFTVFVPGPVALAIPQFLANRQPDPRLPIGSESARIGGSLSVFVGVLLYLHTAFRFGTEGGGTPSPTDEPEELVTGGIYGYTRNPMYVGVLLIVTGQAALRRSVAVLWWAAGCWIGFHNRVTRWKNRTWPRSTVKRMDGTESRSPGGSSVFGGERGPPLACPRRRRAQRFRWAGIDAAASLQCSLRNRVAPVVAVDRRPEDRGHVVGGIYLRRASPSSRPIAG